MIRDATMLLVSLGTAIATAAAADRVHPKMRRGTIMDKMFCLGDIIVLTVLSFKVRSIDNNIYLGKTMRSVTPMTVMVRVENIRLHSMQITTR